MFKRIELHNFRSCGTAVLNGLGHITALIGRNGAGKSNLLLGTLWAAQASSGSASGSLLRPGPRGSRNGITSAVLDIELGSSLYRYRLALVLRPVGVDQDALRTILEESLDVVADDLSETRLLARDDETISLGGVDESTQIRVGPAVPMMRAVASLLPEGDPRLVAVGEVLGFLGTVRYYREDMPAGRQEAGLIRHEAYAAWASEYRATRTPGSSTAFRLIYMSREQPERFEQLRDILRDKLGVVEKIDVRRLHPGTGDSAKAADSGEPDYYSLRFYPLGQTRGFDYSGLSSGTRRLLRIATSLVFDDSSVSLLEQPEDGIHAGLTKKLIGLFRSFTDPSQILMATHSTFILNDLKPQELRLVTIESGDTEVRALNDDEKAAARKYLSEDGTLSDFVQMVEE